MIIRNLALAALAAFTISTTIIGTASAGGGTVLGPANDPTTVTGIPTDHRVGPNTPLNHTYAVECRIKGDNFFVINWGNDNLDSGRQIAWQSPTTGDGGVLTLPKSLAPGQEVMIADLLSAQVLPGTRCDVALT